MRTLKNFVNPLFLLSVLLASLVLYHTSFDNSLFFDSTSLTAEFGKTVEVTSPFQMRWLSHITFRGIDPENTNTLRLHHIINVLIHALNAFLVFVFTRKLFINRSTRHILTATILSASLFLVASSQAYAVAYLIQRSILMATMFILISLIFFVRALESRRLIEFLIAALFYYLGCVSKEHVAMIALFYPVLDYFLRDKTKSNSFSLLSSKIFFYGFVTLIFVLMIIHSDTTPFTAYESHAQAYLDDLKNQSQGTPWLALNFINQSTMLFKYVLLFIIPLTQWMSIDLHFVFPTSLLAWPHILSALGTIFVVVAAATRLRKSTLASKILGVSLLGFFISYSTEFSVVRITEPFVIYRSYFWMIFLVPIFCLVIEWLMSRLHAIGIGLALLCLLCWHAQGTLNRLDTFDSIKTLWHDTLTKLDRTAPGSYRSLNSYGMALASEGNYTEALIYIDESIARNPHYAISYYNKAYCHQFLNQPDLALLNYQKSISLNPNYADAHTNMGAILIAQQKIDDALKHLQSADSINPNNFKTKNNLGAVFDRLNKPEESIKYYQMALNLKPNDTAALTNLGISLLKQDKPKDALTYLIRAHEIDPNLTQTQLNLGMACQKTADYACALQNFNEIVAKNPRDTKALLQIANVQALENKTKEAMVTLKQILSYDPSNSIAYYNLGVLHARNQDYANAKSHFESCLKFAPTDQNCIQAIELLIKQSQN